MRGRDAAGNVKTADVESGNARAGEVEECPLAEDGLVTLVTVDIERVVPMTEHVGIIAFAVIAFPSGQRKVPAIGRRNRRLALGREVFSGRLRSLLFRMTLQLSVTSFLIGSLWLPRCGFRGRRRRLRSEERDLNGEHFAGAHLHAGLLEGLESGERGGNLVIARGQPTHAEDAFAGRGGGVLLAGRLR